MTFLVDDAATSCTDFLQANKDRIRELGGLVLIDDDPDYLSRRAPTAVPLAEPLQDAETGEWVTETEVIESASDLVELYNPAELYAGSRRPRAAEAGLPDEPTGVAGPARRRRASRPRVSVGVGIGGSDPYIGAADDWAADQRPAEPGRMPSDGRAPPVRPRADLPGAQPAVRGAPLEQFETRPRHRTCAGRPAHPRRRRRAPLAQGQRHLRGRGHPRADEDDADEAQWRRLATPDELVQFYDPTDLFGDLAETLAEHYPEVAADEDDGTATTEGDGRDATPG